jgi:hypothetical protein
VHVVLRVVLRVVPNAAYLFLSSKKAMVRKREISKNSKIKAKEEFLLRRKAVGEYRRIHSTRSTRKVFSVTRRVANYWLHKAQDPTFHPKTHGGYR